MSWTQIGSDINSEAAGDLFGTTVALSSDGTTVAIGATMNDGGGINAVGSVRVYKNINNVWTKIGADIDGEGATDISGFSLSISDDGTVVAIGSPNNDGGGNNAGSVRIYKNVSNTWTKISIDTAFDGVSLNQYGFSVALSGNGLVIASGSVTNAGAIKVYSYSSGTTWTQVGSIIIGEAASDNSGWSVSMNYDGTILAIGSPNNDGGGSNGGSVRVYKNVNNTWTKISTDTTFDGPGSGDQAGFSVALSGNGLVVAIGANLANPSTNGTTDSGTVRVFENNNGTWSKIGDSILGTINNEQLGFSVALSNDGTIVAIGAPYNDNSGTDAGTVAVYKNISNVWTKIGSNINGQSSGDKFGYFLSLSNNGKILAVGAPNNDTNGIDAGKVRIYMSPNIIDTPSISSVTVLETTATINFTQSSDGTPAVTSYKYAFSTTGASGTYGSYVTSNWATGTSFTVSGLTVGSTYNFRIIANNGIDSSDPSNSSAVTVVNFAPNTPTISSVTVLETTATINFTQLTNSSANVTSYKYAFSTTGASGTYGSYSTSNWSSGTSFTVSGLTVGSTYNFRIIANNGIDSSESSDSSAVTVSNFAPNAPTILNANGSNTVATIIFTPGIENGSNAITNYAYSTDSVITQNSVFTLLPVNSNGTYQTSSPITIAGLSNGQTYSFTLKAFNGLYSSASLTLSNILVTLPQPPPTITTISSGLGSAIIEFVQQINNSGPIIGYGYSTDTNITDNTIFTLLSTTTSPITITGLTPGQTYLFTLRSYNRAYSRSSASMSVTLFPPPPAPVISTASGANGTAKFIFTQPSSTPDIISYLYSTNDVTFNPLSLRNGQEQRTSPFYIDNLNSLETYSIRFKSYNGLLSDTSSTPVSVFIKLSQPAPVITSVIGNGRGDAIITITQSLNLSDPIQNYYYSNNGKDWILFDPPQTSTNLVINGLDNTPNYNFTLRTYNGYSSTNSNTISNVPINFPDPPAPVITSIKLDNNKIYVEFNTNTSSPSITKYVYSTSKTITNSTVFYDFDNTPDSYRFSYSASSDDKVYVTVKSFNGAFSIPSKTIQHKILVNTVNSSSITTGSAIFISMINKSYKILPGSKKITERKEICYSTDNKNTWKIIEKWPFIIGNSSTNTLTVKFASYLSLSESNTGLNETDKLAWKIFPKNTNTTTAFFVINGNKITIDGDFNKVNIDDIQTSTSFFESFCGFIQNGTQYSNGYNDITIKNLNMTNYSFKSSLKQGEGLLCQSYFGKSSKNNLITDCNINEVNYGGKITSNSGGICGQYTGIGSTNFVISNCTVKCDIAPGTVGENSGGILGSNCGSLSNMLINNCYYTGLILGKGSGGIIGASSSNIKITNCVTTGKICSGGIAGTLTGVVTALNNGLVEITNCNTSGNIISDDNSNYPGGIVSDYAASVTITTCYSKGQIGNTSKNSSGGIIGGFAGKNGGSIIIDKCFSLGSISANCGGIAAENFGVYSGRLHAIKLSYSIGNIGNNGGGIVGPNIAPEYTNTLNYNFVNNSSNTVFSGLGYGYGSSIGSSSRNAFVNILGCCSYGSLATSYSGGIIARTTQTYPAFLTGNKFFLRMLTIYGCISYGTPISTNVTQTAYKNFVNSSYENIYNNNRIIGGDSTLPPVQGIFDKTITEYDGSLLSDINNVVLDTSSNSLNNSNIKPRIKTGLYIGLNNMPITVSLSQLLALSYQINDIVFNNFSNIYIILDTTSITPAILSTPFGGGYTVRSLVNININILNMLISKFSMTYNYLITQQITPIEFYNAGIYNIAWFRDTLGYRIVNFLNNGFKLMDLFPTYTIGDVYRQGYTLNLFYNNNIRAINVKNLPGVTYFHFEGSSYTADEMNGLYTRTQLLSIGYNPSNSISSDSSQIRAIKDLPLNFTAQDVQKTTITATDFMNAGFSKKRISQLGFSATQLYQIGFTASDLYTAGYNRPQMFAAGISVEKINGAQIQQRQPAPLITDIVTYNDAFYVYINQYYSNCSPEVTNYFWSVNGVNWNPFIPRQYTSPLRISGLGQQTYNNIYIGAYNGLPSAIPNKLQKREKIPFEGIPTLTQTLVQAIGDVTGIPVNVDCLQNQGLGANFGINGMIIGAAAGVNQSDEKFYEGTPQEIAVNLVTKGIERAISKAPYIGPTVKIVDSIIMLVNSVQKIKWEYEDHRRLVDTTFTLDWVDFAPVITNVSYAIGKLRIDFSQRVNGDIDTYSYNLNNTGWKLLPKADSKSPIYITANNIQADRTHTIALRAVNYQSDLYNGIYSKLKDVRKNYSDFDHEIERKAFSAVSNTFSFTVNFPNLPPDLILRPGYSYIHQIWPSFTESFTFYVNFDQRQLNCASPIVSYGYSINDGDNYYYGGNTINPIKFTGVSACRDISVRFKSWNGFQSRDGLYGISNISVFSHPSVAPEVTSISTKTSSSGRLVYINFKQPKYSGATITGYYYTTDNGITWKEIYGKTTSPLTISTFSSGLKFSGTAQLNIRIKSTNELAGGILPESRSSTNNVFNTQNIVWRDQGFRFGHKSGQSNLFTFNI